NEPSIVAIDRTTKKPLAVGREAKDMLGRTPGDVVAIKPMKDGVIADFDVTELMLKHFIKQAHTRNHLISPRIVIGIPSEITQVEKRAVQESAMRAKASEVFLVEQAIVAAIGAGLPITEACGSMIVDIGGGTSDIAVISLSGIVYSRSVRVAGNEMDEAIIQYIKRKHNLLIGERTAETIKIELGSAAPLDTALSMARFKEGRAFPILIPLLILNLALLSVQIEDPAGTYLFRKWMLQAGAPFFKLSSGVSHGVRSAWTGYFWLRGARQENERLLEK